MCILVMFRYIFSAFTASSVLTIRRTCGTVVYGYHYCTTSFNKAWTQVLRNFKSCSRCIRDSQWWESLTMIPAENKVKRLSSVNHTKKTIHHHHQHQDFTFVRFNSQMLSCTDESSNDETCQLLPWDGLLVTVHSFVFIHITSAAGPVHNLMTRNRVSESCSIAELCFHR